MHIGFFYWSLNHLWAIDFFSFDTIFGLFSRCDTISIQYFGLRKDLLFLGIFGGKNKINHNFSVSTILDIRRSILDNLLYCEKFRDPGFRSILDTIFSRRVLTPIWTWKKSASNHMGKPFLRPPVPKRQYPFGNNTFQKKASLILIIYRTRSLVNPYQLKPASQQPSFQLQLLLL